MAKAERRTAVAAGPSLAVKQAPHSRKQLFAGCAMRARDKKPLAVKCAGSRDLRRFQVVLAQQLTVLIALLVALDHIAQFFNQFAVALLHIDAQRLRVAERG